MVAQAELVTRDQVPVADTWDLTTIYADEAAWESELEASKELLARAASHRGRLADSPERLRQALDDSMALNETLERVFVYARLRLDEDIANTESTGRLDRVTAFSIEVGQEMAFFDPEVLAMGEEKLRSFIDSHVLAIYRHQLDDLLRHAPHTRSIEVEELLAQSADLARAPRDSFSALDNADLVYGIVTDEHGNEVQLTKGRYQVLLESKDRDVRRRAFETLMSAYEAHRYTLASLHAASVRKDVFYARARNHASAREAALFSYNIPTSVYDSLLTATREAKPAIEKYHELRRRALGVRDLAMYDLYVPLAPEPERTYSYEEAVDVVIRGVEALGETYARDLEAGLRGRWVDVRETKGKRSGAYSWGAYGRPPVILMNWNGTIDHVFTLAHEAGHAMHSFYADRARPFHDAQYSIFLAEIASTINEVLLTWQLLREIPESDVKGRFAILNRLADTISGTMVRQSMFAEFEQKTHEVAERGEPMTVDSLSDLYGEVLEAYVPGIAYDDRTRLGWSRVPHFYNGFYVFQYATGLSAAIALARAIRDEGAQAVARYMRMLEAGGHDYPLNILRGAGVDLESPEPVRAALAEFDATVTELTRLADLGALEG
ncbi:MAG: oligoendopeptidase F [Thermomicrobiales bacterium]|nr:oligoendopeptidase F [Thermomicrobiales bacterium]